MLHTAYITGADRGLGLALTKSLLCRGYQVFAGSYLPEWPELSELMSEYPVNLVIVPLDVSDDAAVSAAAALIASHTESLDLLINNAGIFPQHTPTILEDLDFEIIKRLYNTNTLGPLRVTHSVINLLLKGQLKKLVNISSEAGSISANHRIGNFGYTMSKAALNMQSSILQLHLKEFGVKVLNIHPGYVRSYMSGKFNEDGTVEAVDSAAGILKLVDTEVDLNGPLYLDYEGNPMGW
ncbi:MAG: SDR family NAD(P)-dependent oxidoreductase [Gorillibacterium sp.]|nr:SDR family NAD(P)-dependent oxidoreductase [Gorillibacterium sp.]